MRKLGFIKKIQEKAGCLTKLKKNQFLLFYSFEIPYFQKL